MIHRLHYYAFLLITYSFSQVYQQGDYVKTLSGNICKNNGLEWSSDKTESNTVILSPHLQLGEFPVKLSLSK